MRILLVNPPFKFKLSRASRWPEFTKSGTLYYPIWLAYAAGVLMKKGHNVLLLDALAKGWNFEETIIKIKEFKPDLLAVDSSTPSIHNDIQFIDEVKKHLPNVKVVLVGTHPSVLPEETFAMSTSIDFIARHEYDYTLRDLATSLENKKDLRKVLGLSYREFGHVYSNPDRPLIENLDELQFVSQVYKKFLNISDYRYALARHPMIQIMSSRGCPNMCTFCSLPQTFMGRKFRARTPENFVDEIEWITKNLPEIKEIFIEDDTFTVDKQRILRICDLIDERNLNIVWSVNARADIPFDVLKRMKETGCRMLIVGYESGSDEVLKNIKKGMTIKLAERFTRNAKRAGLKIFGCFMIGLPGDTKETIKQTFQFAKKLNPDMVFFQQAVPFPGTEFYEWVKSNGFLTSNKWSDWLDDQGRLTYLVSYPNLSNNEIRELRDRLMIKFYASPKWIIQAMYHNLNPSEMARLAVAAKDYTTYLAGSVKKRIFK
jgi:radical SAM superfamily enzyme YgiQ (UPF0313 family)